MSLISAGSISMDRTCKFVYLGTSWICSLGVLVPASQRQERGAKNLLEFCQNFGHVAKTFNKLGDTAHEVFTENMKKEDAKNKTE